VLDGDAVLLGVDGLNGLHSRRHDDEVEFYAFDCWSPTVTISGSCRYRCA
jgi:hypothetical protein